MRSRILMVILDGAADRRGPSVMHVTPLEAASTPNLDRLASRGQLGLLYTVGKGVAPESHTAAFALLGYNPLDIQVSRGVIEAIGAGLNFIDGDLAFRCDFATVSGGKIVDRRAGRNLSSNESKILATAITKNLKLKNGVRFEIKPTIGHRAVIIFHTNGITFSDRISNLDPAYRRVGNVSVSRQNVRLPVTIPWCKPLSNTYEAKATADMVNEFARRANIILDNHVVNKRRREKGLLPANFLLLREAGIAVPKIIPITRKLITTGVMMADMPVELGIARITGLEIAKADFGREGQGYGDRAKRALELLSKYELVVVHLKGPDEPGHDGDFEGKRKAVEQIDREFFSILNQAGLPDNTVLCLTCDHATPWRARAHSDDPVPILLFGTNIEPDDAERFTEKDASRGSLGLIEHGWLLLEKLLQ